MVWFDPHNQKEDKHPTYFKNELDTENIVNAADLDQFDRAREDDAKIEAKSQDTTKFDSLDEGKKIELFAKYLKTANKGDQKELFKLELKSMGFHDFYINIFINYSKYRYLVKDAMAKNKAENEAANPSP